MSSGIFNKYTGYHSRRSIRLRDYDYSQPGYYYVTLCIHDWKQKLFGEIIDWKMIENQLAGIVRICWNDLPTHYTHIQLDEFIIMPNHVHGIIHIRDSLGTGVCVGARSSRPTSGSNTNNTNTNQTGRDNRAPTLGKIVAYFKYQSTKQINLNQNHDIRKIWQRNYHDHIIRDEKSLYFIRKYIRENSLKWSMDSENHLSIEEKETKELSLDQDG